MSTVQRALTASSELAWRTSVRRPRKILGQIRACLNLSYPHVDQAIEKVAYNRPGLGCHVVPHQELQLVTGKD